MVRRAILAVVVAASGCAVVGGYDFEGYQVKQQPEIAKSDASATAADASGGDAPVCLPRTCSELRITRGSNRAMAIFTIRSTISGVMLDSVEPAMSGIP